MPIPQVIRDYAENFGFFEREGYYVITADSAFNDDDSLLLV